MNNKEENSTKLIFDMFMLFSNANNSNRFIRKYNLTKAKKQFYNLVDEMNCTDLLTELINYINIFKSKGVELKITEYYNHAIEMEKMENFISINIKVKSEKIHVTYITSSRYFDIDYELFSFYINENSNNINSKLKSLWQDISKEIKKILTDIYLEMFKLANVIC